MKRILKTMASMLVLVFVLASCTRDDESAPQLEVTPNNISGIWALSEVDGEKLPDGLYCYIQFVRRDRTFTMYQKFDSMYPRCLTGTYEITKDDYKGYILSGKYDYGTGDWNNSYIVTGLYESSMQLTADDQSAEVCKYVRCNEIPADIIEWFGSAE